MEELTKKEKKKTKDLIFFGGIIAVDGLIKELNNSKFSYISKESLLEWLKDTKEKFLNAASKEAINCFNKLRTKND